MVALTDAQIQQIIIDEVGDNPQQLLANRIATYWQSFADKRPIHPRLQELYTKRRCIDAVLGTIRNQVTFSTDGALSLQLKQRTDYLSDRRKETLAEITRLEAIARANRPPQIAPLVNVEIETPPPPDYIPPCPPDQNDEVYRGSPYFYNPGTGSNPF